jgi:hypothetical protein
MSCSRLVRTTASTPAAKQWEKVPHQVINYRGGVFQGRVDQGLEEIPPARHDIE